MKYLDFKKIFLLSLFIFSQYAIELWSYPSNKLSWKNQFEIPKPFEMIPGEVFISIHLGYVMGHGIPATFIIEEDDDDIRLLANLSSLNFKTDGRALHSIKEHGLFKKSFDSNDLKIGDFVELPSQKVEIVENSELPENAIGYELHGYTSSTTKDNEKNNLAYVLKITGGYKKSLTDSLFIPDSELKDNCVYVVEFTRRKGNTIFDTGKIYRYFSREGVPLDDFWYYEKNGTQIKIEKSYTTLKGTNGIEHKVFTKKIFSYKSIEETSVIKYKEIQKSDGRLAKNGRIRRGGPSKEDNIATTSKLKYRQIKTEIDASGNKSIRKSEKINRYLSTSTDTEHLLGKERSIKNSDGSWSVFEYHPSLEGDMRTFTTLKGVELSDISGDGEIGIEDLNNTPVVIETRTLTDWQGSRHTKSIKKSEGLATFSENKSKNEYSVSISDEKELSLKYYDHIRNNKGGLVEKITYSEVDLNGNLRTSKSEELVFEGLAMDIPITAVTSSINEDIVSKTITVPDNYILFVDSGFVADDGTPNYSNYPRLSSTNGNLHNAIFSLTGIESDQNTTFTLPWGGTYTANNFEAVSGKTTMIIQVDANSSGVPLYEAVYIYLNGVFHLSEWNYYKYDTSEYPYDLRGTYRSNNSYSTQSALVNNIRNFVDFDGCQYQIYYGGENNDKEIWRRKEGITNTTYGDQKDFIAVISQSTSNTSGDIADEEEGPYALSYFVSPMNEMGAPKATDELLFQTYVVKMKSRETTYNAIEINEYGEITRVLEGNGSNSDYIFKTIKPGYTEQAPSSIFADYSGSTSDGFVYQETGASIINSYYKKFNFKDRSFDAIIGNPNSGRIKAIQKDENGNTISLEDSLGKISYIYNSSGKVVKIETSEGKTISNTYDAFGNMVSSTLSVKNGEEIVPIGIPVTNEKYFSLEEDGLWVITTEVQRGKVISTKKRISGYNNLSEDGLPVIEEFINETESEVNIKRTSIDRNSRIRNITTYKYKIIDNELVLYTKTIDKYLNSIFVETFIKTYAKAGAFLSDFKILRNYDDEGRQVLARYYSGGLHLIDQLSFYKENETLFYTDIDGSTKAVKSLGRLESSSRGKNGLYTGRILEYYDRSHKNAGLLKTEIIANTFTSQGKPLSGKSIHYRYNERGQLTHSWGYKTIPTLYEYNEFGEKIATYTFKDSPENSVAFSNNEWPSGYESTSSETQKTEWTYDPATGSLLEKKDALNRAITRTYDPFGKLLTVIDPKSQTRRFEYDFAGRTILDNVVGATYQYSYNEDEKLSLVSDGTNEYSFVYNDKYDIPIQETFPDGTILNRTLDNNGNITKVTLRKDSNILYEVDYTYNNAEKLESITALGKTIEYERDNNGEITKIKLDNVSVIEYEYDALKTIVSMSYKHDNTELKKLSYTYDSLRNISSIYTHINNVAFSNWQYEYDEYQNTLKSAKLYKGAEQTEYFDSYSQESFEYDLAGNHYNVTKNSPSDNATNITSNKNNQILQIARPSDLVHPIRGYTNTNAELKIFIDNAQQSYTKPLGTSDFLFTLPANITIPKSHKIKIESTLANEGANGVSAKTMTLGSVYTHPRNETLIYDMNGNLIEDSRWKYVWDGRNRLISVKTSDTALASGITNETYVYTYDYKDRKISSKKYIEDDSTGQMVLYSTNLRYYDNWNLIYETIEYTNTSIISEIKKYYYGLDLNNSLHGSSGTGGLRLLEINGVVAFTFNNAKGNIEGLYSTDINASDNLNSSNQLTLALYDYTPFGTIFRQKGPLANKNPLRFSTRYNEGNTKLYYYGYRHYSPDTFKWLSKDPMEEFGGINLYLFCGNDPINYWDRLGLCWWKISMPNWELGELEWPPKIKPQGGYFNSELTFQGDGFNISGMAGINQDETGQFSGSITTSYGDTKFTATSKWNTNSEWGASASVDLGLPGGLGDFKVQGGYDSPKGWNTSSSYEFDMGGGWKGSIGGTYSESHGWGIEFKIFWK